MNSNYASTTKSTHELKNQVLNDIKKVRDDLQEIKERVTPGQLIDDALYYRGMRSPAETFQHLKNNPVGTSFITLGTLLLMEDQQRRSFESIAKDRAGEVTSKVTNVVHQARDTVNQVGEKVTKVGDSIRSKFPGKGSSSSSSGFEGGLGTEGTLSDMGANFSSSTESMRSQTREELERARATVNEKVSSARSNLGSSAESIRSSAQQGMDSAREAVRSASESMKSSAREGIDSARSNMESARERLSSVGSSIKNRSSEALDSAKHLEPLTYLALGAGLGTITGAAIPITETERSVVDEKFEERMSQFSQELEEAINKSANILKNEFIGSFTDFNISIF